MMSEKDFQAAVVEIAGRFDWHSYHTHRSDRSEPGFPDLNMVRGPRLVYAELKSPDGRVTAAQIVWLTRLALSGRCEVYLWRPEHLEHVAHLLSKREWQPMLLGGYGRFTATEIGRWNPSI